MPKILTVHRTQAVWEVETIQVTVPDEVAPADYAEFVEDYLEKSGAADENPTITGAVEGHDIEIDIVDIATFPAGDAK